MGIRIHPPSWIAPRWADDPKPQPVLGVEELLTWSQWDAGRQVLPTPPLSPPASPARRRPPKRASAVPSSVRDGPHRLPSKVHRQGSVCLTNTIDRIVKESDRSNHSLSEPKSPRRPSTRQVAGRPSDPSDPSRSISPRRTPSFPIASRRASKLPIQFDTRPCVTRGDPRQEGPL